MAFSLFFSYVQDTNHRTLISLGNFLRNSTDYRASRQRPQCSRAICQDWHDYCRHCVCPFSSECSHKLLWHECTRIYDWRQCHFVRVLEKRSAGRPGYDGFLWTADNVVVDKWTETSTTALKGLLYFYTDTPLFMDYQMNKIPWHFCYLVGRSNREVLRYSGRSA